MIVATAGHVDHGKTLLTKALTGVDTDTSPEEKSRAMSIDLGFAYLHRESGPSIAFVDVPGHAGFIRNMIAGIRMIDLALLVVAADDGPMPQTIEHLNILRLLGVERIAGVLTKIDRVDPTTRARARKATGKLLDECGLSQAPLFELSGVTGEGVGALSRFLAEQSSVTTPRDRDGVFRMWVDRTFILQGFGLIATGAVASGRIAVGDTVFVPGYSTRARVRGIHADNKQAGEAGAGQRCALNLSGLSKDDLARGDLLVGEDAISPSSRIDVSLEPLASVVLRHNHSVTICLGSRSVRGKIILAPAPSPPAAATGAGRIARLALSSPVPAFHGDRLLVRDAGNKVLLAGGRVLDGYPGERGRSRDIRSERLKVLAKCDGGIALAAGLLRLGGALDLDWLRRNEGVYGSTVADWAKDLGATQFRTGRHWLAALPETVAAVSDAILDRVDQVHDSSPERAGELIDALPRHLTEWPGVLVGAVACDLVSARVLGRKGPFVHRPGHRPSLAAADQLQWDRIRQKLGGGIKPPHVRDLAAMLDMPLAELERILASAVGAGYVFKVAPNRYFLPASLKALSAIAAELVEPSEDGTFCIAQYRDRSGLGRNLSIELLEFFDRMGITKRAGNRRRLNRSMETIFAE